jgi:hypothetical protein
MDEVEAIVERLERIDRLRSEGAAAVDLLSELRELLAEAEAWAEVEGGEAGEQAVSRLRTALAGSLAAA